MTVRARARGKKRDGRVAECARAPLFIHRSHNQSCSLYRIIGTRHARARIAAACDILQCQKNEAANRAGEEKTVCDAHMHASAVRTLGKQ